jgi:arylsulfatase A-like enzyme
VLDEMNLWRDTVVVVTADHGEMQGAHGGLKGKGPFSYEENAHVPLFIAQPAAKAGATSRTLTQPPGPAAHLRRPDRAAGRPAA